MEQRVRESFARQGFMQTMSAELTRIGTGSTEIRFPYAKSLSQQNGFLHAAAVTAALDSACGYAALTVAPEGFEVLSVEFKVNLLSPAAGDWFVARAQVKRPGNKLTVCSADAFAVDGWAGKAHRYHAGNDDFCAITRRGAKQVRRQLTAAHALICYRCFLPDLAGFTGLRCAGPAPDLHDHSMRIGALTKSPPANTQMIGRSPVVASTSLRLSTSQIASRVFSRAPHAG